MFTLEFEDRCRTLLARFSGILVPEDISGLDQAITEIVAWKGPVHGVLFDYTLVEAVGISETFVADRACLPLISNDYKRVMLVPAPELYELARTYAALQYEHGVKEPFVTRSLQEAYELLHLERPNFQPIGY
jgi:hypothetical protein